MTGLGRGRGANGLKFQLAFFLQEVNCTLYSVQAMYLKYDSTYSRKKSRKN